MKKEYWQIVVNYKSYGCIPHTYVLVVSENPAVFLKRYRGIKKYGDSMYFVAANPITEAQYNILKQFNPSLDSMDIRLKKQDYNG